MFIRVTTAPGSSRKTVQLVESARSGKQASKRIVRHIGVARNQAELDKLMELGETMKAEAQCDRQPSVLLPEDLAELAIKAGRAGGRKGPQVDIEKIFEERRVVTGIHEACGAIYRQLEFDALLPSRLNGSAHKVLRHMVMARIANPDSKRTAALRPPEEEDLGVSIAVPRISRMMDRLDSQSIESMKGLAAAAARRLLPEPTSVVFFNCMMLHFESIEEDGLHEIGFSTNGRRGQIQVLMVLMLTSDGLPLGYDVFPQSEFEGKSLIPSLARMRDREGIERAVLVANWDLFSDAHLREMEERGLQYIVGARFDLLPSTLTERILDLESYRSTGESKDFLSAEFEHNDRRVVVGLSRARAAKDAANRRKAVERQIRKLRRNANPAQAVSGRDASRFIKVDGDARLEVDEDKIKRAVRSDSLKGIVTNASDMEHSELLARRRELWRVEESFQITKHDLKLRPVFLWNPERAEAHIAIACMAFACMRHLTYRIALQKKERMSPETIRQALASRQCSILRDTGSGRRYAMPSTTTPDMERIYGTMGLPLSQEPYWIE